MTCGFYETYSFILGFEASSLDKIMWFAAAGRGKSEDVLEKFLMRS